MAAEPGTDRPGHDDLARYGEYAAGVGVDQTAMTEHCHRFEAIACVALGLWQPMTSSRSKTTSQTCGVAYDVRSVRMARSVDANRLRVHRFGVTRDGSCRRCRRFTSGTMRSVMWGVFAAAQARRRGLVPEVAFAAVEHAVAMDLIPQCRSHRGNVASARVVDKLDLVDLGQQLFVRGREPF